MWKRFEDEMPPRLRPVLVVSADGRMWVGCRCDWETCDGIHYQTDSHDPNEIEDPLMWSELPASPLDTENP